MPNEANLNGLRTDAENPTRDRSQAAKGSAAPLTARQVQVLRSVERFLDARGFPPSIRDLCADLDVTSTTGIVEHLKALERKGYLARDAGERRGMRILVASAHARVVEPRPIAKAHLCIRCRREVA